LTLPPRSRKRTPGSQRPPRGCWASLITCANLLADHDEAEGDEGDAYREAVAAINEVTGRYHLGPKDPH
jgi:hypothetical protein